MGKYKTTSAVVDFNMIPINTMHQTQRHTKVDGREKKYHMNVSHKKAGVATSIFDKVDFRMSKIVTKTDNS